MSKRHFVQAVIVTLILLAALASAQTFSVVYNFGSQQFDPIEPSYSGVIAQGRDGNLYSSALGGANNSGAAYKITPSGSLRLLYNFANVVGDGYVPYAGLTLGTDGNFYGTTEGASASDGTIYKMTGAGALTTLYTFTGGTDGAAPYAPPIQGTDGNFYGTTSGGGIAEYGSIYKSTPSGTLTVLYTCDITHCYDPQAALVQGTDGSFYGTSKYGGTNEYGTIFKITSAGALTVLYSFDDTHGRYPASALVQGTDGNFYGTTLAGGANEYGVIFRMTPAGKLTVLHSNAFTDGSGSYSGVIQATDGNFYGANSSNGKISTNCPNGCGTLFELSSTGAHKFSVLYNFDLTTGDSPYSAIFQHTNGIIYGVTELGGTGNADSVCEAGGCGVFYSLDIGAAPFVKLVNSSGQVGKSVEILGQGFSGTSAVSFAGTAATFKVSSNTYLTATVPAGAGTGSVTVTTPGGMLTSSKAFRVTPQIKGFTPPSGPVGTAVTITGVSLTQTSRVTFGGVAATSFTVNSNTQVTATVPTGAKTGKIVITTPGGSATSASVFTVN